AKYVNSPDSVVYQKSRLLYGLDRARAAMGTAGEAVIVEGYTDVIAMHLAGVETAVATCGTALGDDHFDLLRRFTDKVVLTFDSDAAGANAALRGDDIEMGHPVRLDLDLRVALMPDGLDPADLVQARRIPELRAAVANSQPLLEFRIRNEIAPHDLTGPEGRARALKAAVEPLRRWPDVNSQNVYARFIASEIGNIEIEDVIHAIRTGASPQRLAPKDPKRPLLGYDVELLRVALDSPSFFPDLSVDDFRDERIRSAFAAIAVQFGEATESSDIQISRVTDETAAAVLRAVALDSRPLPKVEDINEGLRRRRLDAVIDRLEEEIDELEQGTDTHSDALRRLVALQNQKRAVQDL
ncbi:MAG: toprim domain-containing protein, partial [Acidimicrobiia bacterium]